MFFLYGVVVRQKICKLKQLNESFCFEFIVKNATEEKDAFLIFFKGQYYAYINDCPHTGVNLNWQPGQFFSMDGLLLQCSLHGALFTPENGLCVRGPCQGQYLTAINIDVNEEAVFLRENGLVVIK